MNELIERVCDMYICQEIGRNKICNKCRSKSQNMQLEHIGPIPVFHIGDYFEQDQFKILFIGSVPYGWDEDEFDDIYNNNLSNKANTTEITKKVEKRIYEIFFKPRKTDEKITFIKIIKAICSEIFGSIEEAYPRIAITNVIKCNSGNIRGGAPTHMKSYCANSCHELMVTKQEVDILDPKIIIALAGASGGNTYIESHWGIDKEKILSFKRRGVSFDEYKHGTRTFLESKKIL